MISARPAPAAVTRGSFFIIPSQGPVHSQTLWRNESDLFRDFRQGPDWLAVGKIRHLFFLRRGDSEAARLPVDTFGPRVFKEGGGLVQAVRHFNAGQSRAPSERGQGFYQLAIVAPRPDRAAKALSTGESPGDSLRIDIPKDEMPLLNRRLDGVKYVDTGRPEMLEMKPILDVVNEALKAAGKY